MTDEKTLRVIDVFIADFSTCDDLDTQNKCPLAKDVGEKWRCLVDGHTADDVVALAASCKLPEKPLVIKVTRRKP